MDEAELNPNGEGRELTMNVYVYTVTIKAPSERQARQALVEREYDEDYGFDYLILDWDLLEEVLEEPEGDTPSVEAEPLPYAPSPPGQPRATRSP